MLKQIETSDAIIYGMGSLYTSIVPNLILRDVGEAIAQRNCPKILMFNGSIDRETSGMTATDYILAIVDALNRKHTEYAIDFHVSDYVTHKLTPDGGQFIVDDDARGGACKTAPGVGVDHNRFARAASRDPGGCGSKSRFSGCNCPASDAFHSMNGVSPPVTEGRAGLLTDSSGPKRTLSSRCRLLSCLLASLSLR